MSNAIDWAVRKARARAFVQQQLKPRHHWTEKPYAYDAEQAHETALSRLGAERERLSRALEVLS